MKANKDMIPTIHRLITSMNGENYWFNGCAAYVMECLGEKDFDYSFFALLTGDNFTQFYKQPCGIGGLSECKHLFGDTKFASTIFKKCGYDSEFVSIGEMSENKDAYIEKMAGYISKGIPVIYLGDFGDNEYKIGVIVGYADDGEMLLCITGDEDEPKRIACDTLLTGKTPAISGWIFVGEKKESKSTADICREAIYALPGIMTDKHKNFYIGAEAFRMWADDVQNGYFEKISAERFDFWAMYANFICVLATNAHCAPGMLRQVQVLNPDMTFIEEIAKLYERQNEILTCDNGADLEAIGANFNVTLETLQNKDKQTKIASKLIECAEISERVAEIIQNAKR